MKFKLHLTSLGFLISLYSGLFFALSGVDETVFTSRGESIENSLRTVDTKINDSFSVPRSLNSIFAGVEYRFLSDAGSWVKAGCPDWLFLHEELREYPNGERNLQARLRIATKLTRMVGSKNAKLVILPVPDKSELASGNLCGAAVAEQAKRRAVAWRSAMKSYEYLAIDVREGWPSPGFLRTDSHWDVHGAKFAARKTATKIVAIAGSGRGHVTLSDGSSVEQTGDLVRLADLSNTYLWSGPKPDVVHRSRSKISFSGDLLDAPLAPRIVLAGSSFSLNSSFHDLLQFELQEPVLQRSKQGSGFAGTMFDLIQHKSALVERAEVIIWEFPMRVLTQPLTPAETEFLQDEK